MSDQTSQLTDWVSDLADQVIAEADRRGVDVITCASGLSPSGPIHLGNLREVMVPHLVADEIRRRGRAVRHIISWDDFDRYRKVPFGVPGVTDEWNAHIGKPLTDVPPPPGSDHPSWGEHFKAAMVESLDRLGVEFEGISQTQMYTSGAYTDKVLFAMSQREKIDTILDRYRTKVDPADAAAKKQGQVAEEDAAAAAEAAEGSGAAAEDDGSSAGNAYYPYKPYCAACGTDFTTVTAYDDDTAALTYTCRCGHTETIDLRENHRGKLVWKVDWPMRWTYEGVSFEPSGVDHQSPGSSWVVGEQIVSEVFDGQRPIGPMYAFVGIKGMAKMSSSKGGVPTPADAMSIMEPALLRWLYTRRRPNQSFQVAFDAEIQRLYDEWDSLTKRVQAGTAGGADVAAYTRASSTAAGDLPMTPHPLPYRMLASVLDITTGDEAQTLRILAAADAQRPVTSLDELRPRLDKAAEWVRTQMDEADRIVVRSQPDTERLAALTDDERESLRLLAEGLDDDWSLDGLTTLVYGVPKRMLGLPVDLKKPTPELKVAQRAFFVLLYELLIGKDTGPRLPTLLLAVGADRIRTLVGQG